MGHNARTDRPAGVAVPYHQRQATESTELQRAVGIVGVRPMRVYECRRAAATTWLRSEVPLGETARRLGHSVEMLVTTYVGALNGDEEVANQRIDDVLGPLPTAS